MATIYSQLSGVVDSKQSLERYQVAVKSPKVTGIDTRRLKEAMTAAGVDQSGLARAAGCTPGAINQIVAGNVSRSRFLPDIADALGVSLRWLKGEDVPRDPVAPIVPRQPMPIQLVTMDVALPHEAALIRMFQVLLDGIDPDLSRDEQAQLLALRLPSALSQLRGVRPAQPVPMPVSRELEDVGAARAMPDREPRR